MKVNEKGFSCVKMKNEIQQTLLKQYEGLTEPKRLQEMKKRLANSKSPIAKFWRQLQDSKVGTTHESVGTISLAAK